MHLSFGVFFLIVSAYGSRCNPVEGVFSVVE